VADERLHVPPALRARIAADLRPVAPLRSPFTRTLVIVPIALALLVAAAVVFGLRRDASRIGIGLTWGASVAQMLLGLTLVVAALRESVPGTTLARRTVGVFLGTTLVAVLALTIATWTHSPTRVAAGWTTYVWSICLTGTIVSALPALAVAGWLSARAFPLRPRVAGALYGVGAGLMADAGWRLFCHFSDPVHVLGSHTAGIALVAILGLVFAGLIGRR